MLPRRISTLFICFAIGLMLQPQTGVSETLNEANCTLGGRSLYGKVQIVESFADIAVKIVTAFPDLKVKTVSNFPDRCGKWQFVESFPDFKIRFVTSFPDLTIQFVDSFPGIP